MYAAKGKSRRRTTGRIGRSRRRWSDRIRDVFPGREFAGLGERPVATAIVMLTITVMMLAGGPPSGFVVTLLIGIAGLALLAALSFSHGQRALATQPLLLRIGLFGIAVVPLLQIVPLPPSWWHALPGQELRIRALSLAGIADSWQPLSVTPLMTAGVCIIAIAFTACVALLLTLPAKQVLRVAWLIQGVIALNIVIGVVQVASGGQAMQFYESSDHGALIGFYANKNHAALVLAASMPIMAYLLGARAQPKGARTWLALCAGVVLVSLITTNSRAGLGLGCVTALLLGSIYVRNIKPAYGVMIAVAAIGGLVFVTSTSAFELVFSRFGNVDQDLRWEFLSRSWPIIEQYWFWGSGIGSFSTLYVVGEHLAWVQPTYVNQLHNDYPQLLLETGVPGTTVFFALVIGLVWRGSGVWRAGNPRNRLPLLCGGWILILIAVHSAVDYPLRRPAVLPILALAIILVIRGDLVASTGLGPRKQRV